MRQSSSLLAFNRGIISRYGLARIDLDRAALSAEIMTNWMPRVLGSMMLRPGFEYTGATYGNNKSRSIPFVYSRADTARIELTDNALRVLVDDSLVTRPAVTAAVTNGSFGSDVTGWTDNDEVGGTSQWQTGGYLALLGDGTNAAIRDQQVTVNEANTVHALNITIERGPVTVLIGSSSGGDEYLAASLGTGVHSLAFTPTGNFHIRFMSRLSYTVLVDSVAVASSGAMVLSTAWNEADLPYVRTKQSGDVVYLACDGYAPKKIERRANNSWSVVEFEPVDGPFRTINPTNITIATSALTGDVTLTASEDLFESGHSGALFRIQSSGQTVSESINAQNTFSDPIRVTGVDAQRAFSLFISGTFTATVVLQYSIAEPGSWVDYSSYTTEQSIGIDDGLDNQIIYYRIGVKTGGFTSGPVSVSLVYGQGSITGVARITSVTNATTASAVVLNDFGATTASSDWWEGAWSDYQGWPSAVALHEGRLWFAGRDKIYGSISDDFESFDDEVDGDSGMISRNIGEGPVDTINWLLSLGRMIVGTESISNNVEAVRVESSSCLTARSSSFDEPLTPTNFNMKFSATTGLYVSRAGTKLMQTGYDVQTTDFLSSDLTMMVPDLTEQGIVHISVQQEPDTRIHCVLTDGTMAVLVYDRLEEVKCWVEIETDGVVEDVCVLPGDEEDRVYYTVRRTINGSTVRYHEKWALQSECRGGTLNKQADAFYEYSGASTTTITGLSHLEGESVVVWGGGAYLGSYTVSSGQITGLTTAVTSAIVGLSYEARFKSAKQAISRPTGSPLNETRKIDQIGLILLDTHKDGLYYGPDFTTMDALPDVEDGAEVDGDYVWESYDKDKFTFPGEWTTDSRICLKAIAPKPCTISAVTVDIKS